MLQIILGIGTFVWFCIFVHDVIIDILEKEDKKNERRKF